MIQNIKYILCSIFHKGHDLKKIGQHTYKGEWLPVYRCNRCDYKFDALSQDDKGMYKFDLKEGFRFIFYTIIAAPFALISMSIIGIGYVFLAVGSFLFDYTVNPIASFRDRKKYKKDGMPDII